MSSRPQTANSISGKSIDLQAFYASVVFDLQNLSQRISDIETRLTADQVLKIPQRSFKLKSLRV